MSRIRSIKPEYWTSAQVMDCSRDARLLFIGLWNFCDDQGRMSAAAKQIRALVFPGDDDVNVESVRRMIVELSTNDLIQLYTVDDKEYLQVSGWRHQKIDKPQQPKFPPPPDHSSNVPRMVSTDRIGSEGIGKDSECATREADFRQAIVQTFQRANSPSMVNTSRAAIWLSRGHSPEICLAVIADILARKPSISNLSYFDKPIADAHVTPIGQARAGPRKSGIADAMEFLAQVANGTGNGSKGVGGDFERLSGNGEPGRPARLLTARP